MPSEEIPEEGYFITSFEFLEIIGQKILATLRLRVIDLFGIASNCTMELVWGILSPMAVTILCRKLGQDSSHIQFLEQPRNRQLEVEN